MTPEVVVGVDVGSGSSRAIALDADGTVVAASRAEADEPYTATGEVIPSRWLDELESAVGALGLDRAPAAIGVGGFGPVSVVDQEALTFRFPAGDVADPRDQHAAQGAELRRRHGGVEPRILWDWIVGTLVGRFDFQSVWPGDRPIEGFGDPVPVGTPVGSSRGMHGVAPGIPVVPATNDAYLTAWAVGIDRPGRAFDPGGRTGGLGVAISSASNAAPYGMPSAVPGVVVVGGPTAAHGAMLDWWADTVQRPISDLLDEAAEVPAGSRGVLVLPYLEGERAPRWDARLGAEIVGLRGDHGSAEVTRAILECTAYGLRHIALATEAGVLDRLVCCGKPARSRLWTSIKAAVMEVPVEVPDQPETAAFGAALAAGAGIGWWPRPGHGESGDWPMPGYTTIEAEPADVHRTRFDQFVRLGDQAVQRLPAR